MNDFRGKTAVVTGAASGIGRALAQRFCDDGMKVVLADRDAAALARAESELRASGAEVLAVVTDVSDGAQVAALATRTQEAFGELHVLCNNAGVGGASGPIWKLSENDWTWALGVNLWSVIHGLRAFVPLLLAHGGEGHIVNTASVAGLSSPTYMGSYVATKHAVVALSEVLARDLQTIGAKIRVSVLCPGFVRTNIADTEQHRPAHLRDVKSTSTSAAGKSVEQAIRKLVEQGKSPAEIADHVVNAIRDGRFYILPHPELTGLIGERMHDILDGRYPRFDPDQLKPEKNRA
jgi:NAD(P)-dependent dehydrogenase (short-subunit alcohol dehydrogenase family)